MVDVSWNGRWFLCCGGWRNIEVYFSINANIKDERASTFVALFCCLYSRICPVVEGSPPVLRGVCPAAGERAGAGPAEGGRVSVCPQGDARQDPGHGEGEFPQVLLRFKPIHNVVDLCNGRIQETYWDISQYCKQCDLLWVFFFFFKQYVLTFSQLDWHFLTLI